MGENDTSRSKHIDFIILDLVCVELSFVLAYAMRLGSLTAIQNNYIIMNLLLVLVHIVVAFFTECYSGILRRGYFVEFKKVYFHNFLVAAIVFGMMFMVKVSSDYSRIMLGLFFALNSILMWLIRSLRKSKLLNNSKNIKNKNRMLLVCSKDKAELIITDLLDYQYEGYSIIGVAVTDGENIGESIKDIPIVANGDTLLEYVRVNVVDEVFMLLEDDGEGLSDKLLTMGVRVHISLDELVSDMPNAYLDRVSKYTVITTSNNVMSFKQRIIKRAMDIVGGMVGLLITGILFIIFAPIIYIQSPGPVFFKQDRVGKNGRIFKIRKFRSMYLDAEERKKELMDQNKMSGHMFKMDNDPRIIPIGSFIRRTSIDEFPQFWNVLKGEMSLVGTRPPTIDEVEKYELHHKSRLAVKPGLTGVWQTSGRSDITDFEEVVRLDNEYIRNFSLGLDIKLLWKTVIVILGRKGSV